MVFVSIYVFIHVYLYFDVYLQNIYTWFLPVVPGI